MAEMTAPVSVRPKRKVVSTALWIMVPLVMVVAPATVLLLVLGLLPTIVAWFVDRREEKYAAYCVGGFNLSGVMPYLFVLWASGNRMHDFYLIAKNPFAWLVMLGAAALGWLANYWAPQVAMRVRRIRDRNEVSRLRKRQEQILEEWGPEVMPPESM
jgi:hypothetical protein